MDLHTCISKKVIADETLSVSVVRIIDRQNSKSTLLLPIHRMIWILLTLVFRYWLILKEQKKNRNLLGGFFPKKRRIPLGCGDFYLALPSCYLFGYLFMVQMQIFVVFLLQAECSAIYSGWFGKRSSASFKSCKLDAVWSGIGRCYSW